MSRLCLYYRPPPEKDRWLPGDRHARALVRRMVRGPRRPGGLDKVFINLSRGLDQLGAEYAVNLPFVQVRPEDRVGVLGVGRHCLNGYRQPNPLVAGIGLMTHPSEWPTLCEDYPVVRYLQHSEWANNVYKPYFGSRCTVWPVGIDTEAWQPRKETKTVDFLIYDKIRWEHEARTFDLVRPVEQALTTRGCTFESVSYGSYQPEDFHKALARSRAMIFLCEHESQGIAYQECLSSGVPILAWDQGWCLDPNRFSWGAPEIPATSVPYWDARCGVKFRGAADFQLALDEFLAGLKQGRFAPRDYIVENLNLERCAAHFLEICRLAVANGSSLPA